MIKKEMNYINNSLKQIVIYMDPKLNTLEKLVKSFTTLDLKKMWLILFTTFRW